MRTLKPISPLAKLLLNPICFLFTLFLKSVFLSLWSWNHSRYFRHYPFSRLSPCIPWFIGSTAPNHPRPWHLVLSVFYLAHHIQAFRFSFRTLQLLPKLTPRPLVQPMVLPQFSPPNALFLCPFHSVLSLYFDTFIQYYSVWNNH